MAIDLAQLVVSLEANSAKFQKDIERVDQRLKRFEKSTSATLGNVKKLFFGLGVGAAVREIYRFADSIGDSAKRAGLSTRAYQELRHAATQLDLEHGELDGALLKFNKTLGDARIKAGEAAKAFKALGLDPAQFKDADSAFIAVTQRLGRVSDQFARASLQAQLFGKDAGPKLADFLSASASEMDNLRKEAHAIGAVLSDEIIDKADKTTKQMDALSTVLKVQLAEALINLAPALTGMAGGLKEVSQWLATGFKYAQGFADEISRLGAFGEVDRRGKLATAVSLAGPPGMLAGSMFDFGIFADEETNKAVANAEETTRALDLIKRGLDAILDPAKKAAERIEYVTLAGTGMTLAKPDGAINIAAPKDPEMEKLALAAQKEADAQSEAASDYEFLMIAQRTQEREATAEYVAEWEEKVEAQLDAEADMAASYAGMNAMADQAARNIQSFTASLVDAALAGDNMGDVVVAALRRMAAEMLTLAILQKVMGTQGKDGSYTGGLLSGFLNGLQGRADGGPVSGGTPYMVGERGPELFVPRNSGTIVPNGALGGGMQITQHIDARGADPASAANMLRALDASNRRLKSEIYEEQRRGYAPA